MLPQYYYYRATYTRVQLFRNRFSSTPYRIVIDLVAELNTALAATGTPVAATLLNPYPVGNAPVAESPTVPIISQPSDSAPTGGNASPGSSHLVGQHSGSAPYLL